MFSMTSASCSSDIVLAISSNFSLACLGSTTASSLISMAVISIRLFMLCLKLETHFVVHVLIVFFAITAMIVGVGIFPVVIFVVA